MISHVTFLEMALLLSEYGTCSRLKVGAVLTKDGRVISTGFNGVATKLPHCVHTDNRRCHSSVHAEANCIAFAAKHGQSTEGTILYCNIAPCGGCAGILINSGVREVHYLRDYRSDTGIRSFKEAGIAVMKHGNDE